MAPEERWQAETGKVFVTPTSATQHRTKRYYLKQGEKQGLKPEADL